MIRHFLLDESGDDLAKYAIAVALFVVIGLLVLVVLTKDMKLADSATKSQSCCLPH